MNTIFQNPSRYDDVIQYYTLQKEQFLKFIQNQKSLVDQQAFQENDKKFIKDIKTSFDQSLTTEGVKDATEIAQSLINAIGISQTLDRSTVHKLRSEWNKKLKDASANLEKIKQQSEEEYQAAIIKMSNDSFDSTIGQSWQQTLFDKVPEGMVNSNLIRQHTLTYLKQVYYKRIVEKRGYILSARQLTKILGGYYREYLIASAINNYFENTINVQVQATGSKNKIEDLIIQYKALSGSGQGTITIAGLQSKSWILPTLDTTSFQYKIKSNNAQWFYSISSNAKLLKSFESSALYNKYSWHDNLDFLGLLKNAQQAIGLQNILYLVHNTLLFTDDLIRTMRDSDFYISFTFNRNHEATSHITWQQLMMYWNYLAKYSKK